MERLVHRELSKYLSHYHKLCPTQHGFRSHHSCQTLLLKSVHQRPEALDDRSSTHVIFLDFSKAFDTVPHKKLCLKLDLIGIRGKVLTWIESFLTNRQQRVLVDNHSSQWSSVSSGVPQGSILGPLLFLIYVNDISYNLSSPTRMFADNCTLSRENKCRGDCVELQKDLTTIYNWSQTWQIHLNTSKCKSLCISNK